MENVYLSNATAFTHMGNNNKIKYCVFTGINLVYTNNVAQNLSYTPKNRTIFQK